MASEAWPAVIGALVGSALTIAGQTFQSVKQISREQTATKAACVRRLSKIAIAVSSYRATGGELHLQEDQSDALDLEEEERQGEKRNGHTPPLERIDFKKTANNEVLLLGGDADRFLTALAYRQSRRLPFFRLSCRDAMEEQRYSERLDEILMRHNLDDLSALQSDLEQALGLSGSGPKNAKKWHFLKRR